MHRLVVPVSGSSVIVTVASVLIGVMVLSSPDTHANLWEAVRPGYTRTPLSLPGQEVGDVELMLDVERLQRTAVFGLDRGRAVYLSRGCATCHGLDARGGPVGPSLAGSSLQTVRRMVREGRGGMPAYTDAHLGEADLAALVAYLRGLEVLKPSPQEIAALQRLTYDPAVPVDMLLKGKTAIRRSCGACHAQPGSADILRAFRSDARAAGLVAEMAHETNLSLEDARAIAYYMLAILNGADPVEAP